MWTLAEAQTLIQALQPKVHALGYHVTLGGGVINRGSSEKDLDLFFIPKNGEDSAPRTIVVLLMGTFGIPRSLRDSPDYQANYTYHCKEMLMFHDGTKRIDVFIQ
jgi:hypothetical protein